MLNAKLFRVDTVDDEVHLFHVFHSPAALTSSLQAAAARKKAPSSLLQLPTTYTIFDGQVPSRKFYLLIEPSSCEPSLFVPRALSSQSRVFPVPPQALLWSVNHPCMRKQTVAKLLTCRKVSPLPIRTTEPVLQQAPTSDCLSVRLLVKLT